MATEIEVKLASRVLHKIRFLDPDESAEGVDLAKALEKLEAAHAALKVEGLVRWTLADIPVEVQEAYVLLAAFLAAEDYGAPADPSWSVRGLRMVQAYVHVPIGGSSSAENF